MKLPRFFSSGLFAVALMLFTMPFLEMRCSEIVYQFNGTDLLLGSTQEPVAGAIPENQAEPLKNDPSLPVIAAFVFALVAMLIGFSRYRRWTGVVFGILAIGGFVLFYLNPGFGWDKDYALHAENRELFHFLWGAVASFIFVVAGTVASAIPCSSPGEPTPSP